MLIGEISIDPEWSEEDGGLVGRSRSFSAATRRAPDCLLIGPHPGSIPDDILTISDQRATPGRGVACVFERQYGIEDPDGGLRPVMD